MKKQTVVQKIFEQMNLLSNHDFQSWMLNNTGELLLMEREQIVEAYLEGVQTIHHEDYLPVPPIFTGDDKCSKNGIRKEGESCTLNDNCIYPKCLE